MILEAKSISISYGEKRLLNNIDFNIEDNNKIGLIGVNGCGKSTFLSIMGLVKEPEKGTVNVIGKKTISYMPQEIDLTKYESNTIEEYLNIVIEKEPKKEEMAFHEVKSVLTQLEINDFSLVIKNLSGGTKRKLALGVSLARPSDLIILDEPTNHLDSDIIEWLEKYLIKTTKAVLLVTHDRYFLERVCNRIAEIDSGNIYLYEANYSLYLSLKSERIEMEKASQRKINAFLRKEYDWIKRGALARTTKDRRRIENYEALTDKEKIKDKTLVIDSISSRLGKKTIEFKNVSFQYQEKLFANVSFNLNKDERIGLIGKNGTGKSTFLDLMCKLKEPTSGEVIIGETIKIGYFRQENIELDYNLRAIEYISNIASYVKTKNGTISSSQMLENFLFDDPYIYIGKLSGGEKRRLYLLGVLMSSPNVLLLDEPTNDLDITTLAILEDYLDDFDGIVIAASHDRYFLDRVCEKIWVINNQRIDYYNGNYSDYNNYNNSKNKQNKVSINNVISDSNNKDKTAKVKLTYKEQKEFDEILFIIDDIENKLKEVNDFINNNFSNYQLCKDYYTKKEELEKEYEEKLDRWEYLNSIFEQSKN